MTSPLLAGRTWYNRSEPADIDVLSNGIDHYALAKWIVAKTDCDQLILEFVDETGRAGWIHVSYVTRRANRHSIKIAQRVMDDAKRWRTRYKTITADQISDCEGRSPLSEFGLPPPQQADDFGDEGEIAVEIKTALASVFDALLVVHTFLPQSSLGPPERGSWCKCR